MKDLAEPAKGVAEELLALFPVVEFTSGRRTVAEQALVMAKNVALERDWIRRTYSVSAASLLCQAWVERNQQASRAEMAAGLALALRPLPMGELRHLSKHLAGLAFDLRPVPDPVGTEVKVWLRKAAVRHGGKFLEREGGLVIWHWQAG